MAKTKPSHAPKRPYNQGRDEQIHGRATAEEKALIFKAVQMSGKDSLTDWCVWKAREDLAKSAANCDGLSQEVTMNKAKISGYQELSVESVKK